MENTEKPYTTSETVKEKRYVGRLNSDSENDNLPKKNTYLRKTIQRNELPSDLFFFFSLHLCS